MEETSLVERQPAPLATGLASIDMKELVKQRNDFLNFTKKMLKEGTDFGTIPGCGPKPTLLKPGSEKILRLYNCRPEYNNERVQSDELIRYVVTCTAFEISSGLAVSSGSGAANSGEQKYMQQILSRNDRARQKAVREKKDPPAPVTMHDMENTILKMAMKRALVSCAQALGCASEFFTQDIEDMPWIADEKKQERAPRQAAAQKKADATPQPPPEDTKITRVNPEYGGREEEITVTIPALFKTRPASGRSLIFVVDGQDTVFPIKQVKAYGAGVVTVTHWIAQKKVEEGKLDESYLSWGGDAPAHGDAWEGDDEPPPHTDSDVPM